MRCILRILRALLLAALLCAATSAAVVAPEEAAAARKLHSVDAASTQVATAGGGRQLQFLQFFPEEAVVCLGTGFLAGALTANPLLGLAGCALTAGGTGLILEIISLVCAAMGPLACTIGAAGR